MSYTWLFSVQSQNIITEKRADEFSVVKLFM